MANDIELFFKEHYKRELSGSSKSRHAMHIPKTKDDIEPMLDYVEKRLVDFLSEQPSPDPDLIARVRLALADLEEADASPAHATIDLTREDGPHVITGSLSTPILPSELTRVALQHLFGIEDHHFSVVTALDGDYFGYRRSANLGDIVRMYVRVTRSKDEGILRFENWYRRDNNFWKITGFGIVVEGTTYLFGHAVSDTDKKTSVGLRAYALLNYQNFGWFLGPLTSMYDHYNPIAARVVLLPASHHRTYRTTRCTNEDQRTAMICKLIEDEKIGREEFENEYQPESLRQPEIPWFVQLECLIWNGTFTTLRAKPDDLSKNYLGQYELLSKLQRRAIEYTQQTGPTLSPFLRFAEKMHIVLPEGQDLESGNRDPT